MPIRFYCPLGHRLVVPDERAGKKGRCPQCQQRVYVPVADPRPGGQPQQPQAGEAIELDQAGGVPPVVLEAPQATSPRARQGQEATPAVRGPSAAKASAAAAGDDAKDPLVLALNEITAMQRGNAIVYMPVTEQAPSHSGSVSKWLPPKIKKELAAAAAAEAPAGAGPQAVAGPQAAPVPPGPSPGAKAPLMHVAAPTQTMTPIYTAPAATAFGGTLVRGWIRAADPDEIARAFRPDEPRLQVMYLLAGGLMLVALLSSWPALTHFRRSEAAPWVAAVLLMSVAMLVYVIWLISLADWSTLRVGMALCGACAAAYACGLAIVVGTRQTSAIVLGLDEVRSSAGLWCALQIGLLGALCYGFGHQANAWRDAARGIDRDEW